VEAHRYIPYGQLGSKKMILGGKMTDILIFATPPGEKRRDGRWEERP
jgi:hypothetical protein